MIASCWVVALTMAIAVLVAGCGGGPDPPIVIVQNYLNVLGEGDYTGACVMVDSHELAGLMRSKHARMSCATFFRRCLPNRSVDLKSDQTQLLYANIDVSLSHHGTVANADTSATQVATELKHVTLTQERGVWKVTGFGRAIAVCRPNAHRHKHRKHNKHSPPA
jgi:hypothetical protein